MGDKVDLRLINEITDLKPSLKPFQNDTGKGEDG